MTDHQAVATAVRPAGRETAGVRIARVNPLEHANAIKELFVTHDRPEFPAYFDREYGGAGAHGVTSWVGWDEGGRLVAHVAQFRREFMLGRRIVRGSLLANMMVATAYRTFWPVFTIVRHMIKDSKESGADLLYADPNEPARAIAQAAGFRPLGSLRRFVLPVTDGRPGLGLAIRAYQLLKRLRAGTVPLVVTEHSARDLADGPGPLALLERGSLDPIRGETLYRGRLPDYPSAADRWYAFRRRDAADALVGRALVRGPDEHGSGNVWVLEAERVKLLHSLVVALTPRLRALGMRRLQVHVMDQSRMAGEMRRVGFVPRPDCIPIVALPFTALGAEAIARGVEWHLLPIDVDR